MLFMFDRTLNKPEVPAPVLSNSSLLLISYLHANLALLLIQGYIHQYGLIATIKLSTLNFSSTNCEFETSKNLQWNFSIR